MLVNELPVDDLAALMARGEAVRLIDVRTPGEVARGAIPKAEHLPLHLLPLHAEQMPRQGKVVFYCATGARSAQACLFMRARGIEHVYNLSGGIREWIARGMPLGEQMVA